MAVEPLVLLLTNKLDVSADLVVLRLQARQIPYLRINVEDAPSCLVSAEYPAGRWVWKDPWHGAVDLNRVSSVWYRRPGNPKEDDESLSAATRSYLAEQWRSLVLGLRALPDVTWVNDPISNAAAELKVLQLATAVRVGLRIPQTCVTNDLAAAGRLQGPLVAKSLGGAFLEETDANYFIYTQSINLDEATSAEVQLAPVIFQQRLWPKEDYRVTIVGSHVFAAMIPEGTARPLDWRATSEPPQFERVELPRAMTRKLMSLLRGLGLRFGAIDLCRAHGDFFFLEVNPNGEWGWLETSLGFPIADAIVDELCQTSAPRS